MLSKSTLTPTMESKFRKLAEDGYGDDVLYLDHYAWVIFRLSAENWVCVRQNGAACDLVELRKAA